MSDLETVENQSEVPWELDEKTALLNKIAELREKLNRHEAMEKEKHACPEGYDFQSSVFYGL